MIQVQKGNLSDLVRHPTSWRKPIVWTHPDIETPRPEPAVETQREEPPSPSAFEGSAVEEPPSVEPERAPGMAADSLPPLTPQNSGPDFYIDLSPKGIMQTPQLIPEKGVLENDRP